MPKIPGEKSIRLATIYPGVGDDDVLVDLHIESFTIHSPPRYEALSYVWGSTEPPEFVWVGSPGRATLQVTTNLRTALQHIRYPDQERVMWVDALCINQSDDVEKGAEVARMGELFACAAHVVVWLGPEADGSDMAMERLDHIGSQVDVDWGGMHRITPSARLEPVDGSIADPNSDLPMDAEQSAAVVSLLNRGWFDRLWIRQEILVAEDKAFVCCGPYQMPWSVFRKALRLFYSRRSEPYNVVYLLQKRMKVIGGFVFQLRWTDVLGIRGIFDNALCSDPRDRIYGIKSLLLEDQQGWCGQPDYTRPTVDLYSEFTRNCIMGHPNGLTILRQCELSQIPNHWSGPSWVPDWSTRASFHWGEDTFASSQIQGSFAFPEIGTLRVLGVSRTVVTEMRAAPKFYDRDWSEAVEFLRRITPPQSATVRYSSGGSLLRAIARTVLFGAISDFVHVRDGNYPTSQIAETVVNRFVSGGDLVEEDYKMGSDAQRFLKRMDWGSGGNNFFLGTGGYVGVAPPSTNIGDEIFVVLGCQQPLVLRNCLKGTNRYSVVGECYVEGCARGEPLVGNLPGHIGFSMIEGTAKLEWSRRFMDLRSGEIFHEDPRLESLGVNLEEFRARLTEEPEAMLSLSPEVLRKRIADLQYIDLI
ncbi:hypothetical protein LA080_011315 [Diaporthe eres]|nr:hypothetical protein LA080_011315 [Diaporthe eres]